MDARFKIAAPHRVHITLTLTAPAEEWEEIRKQLDQTPSSSPPDRLGRQIGVAIEQAQKALFEERWTTGYASQPVSEVEQ
jgi:hypothetical protein